MTATLPPIVPLEVLFGNPDRTQASISPDGRKLAYLAPVNGVLNIWVGDLGSEDFKPVTEERVRGVPIVMWAEDSRHLLFIQDTAGDENWHLHTVDIETGEINDRTPFPGAQASPSLHMSPDHPGTILVGVNKRDPRYHDMYRFDLASGELTLVEENPGFDDWIVDHDLQVRGGSRAQADGGVIYDVRNGGTGGYELHLEVGPDDALINVTGPLTFTADNRRIYFRSTQGANTSRLVAFDPTNGETEVLAEDPHYDVVGVGFHPTTHEPQWVTFGKDRAEHLVLDPSVRDDFDALREVHPGDFSVTSRTRNDDRWLVAFTADDGPVAYYLWTRGTKKATKLFTSQPALEDYTLAKTEAFSFAAEDGLVVHGYITFPPNLPRENLPAVVEVHGGPWGARDAWGYAPTRQWLANRGYVCIQVNYRGSGGYGKDFLNASNREWAGKMHTDLIDGLQWAVDKGWVDPARVAIFGGSYGGYAALVGATFTPDTFACAVDIVGPSNLVTLLESIPPYWVGVATQFHKLLGHPERDRDFLMSRSPISKVDQIRIPMLIGQGANDPRVKQAESEQIVAAMKERGIDHEYLLFEDEGHGFARPENRDTFYRAAERFLAKHIGGRSED